MSRAPKSYSFEVKLALVQRFLAGETGQDLAVEAGLSSRQQLQKWVRDYRLEGEDGLRPKRNGRPVKSGTPASRNAGVVPSAKSAAGPRAGEASELEQLRRENELLRAQVAYLGKLRALRAQEQR
ncbi:helix-turn-helix domain-containing protein [Arthrobacter sp. alpha11c]